MTDAALRTLPQAPVELPRRELGRTAFNTVMWAVFIGLLVWGWVPAGMNNVVSLLTGASNMAEYAQGFLAPDFHSWPTYLREMVITVQIALWGTFLAVIVGVPLGILCSENMAPIWIVQPVRRLMDALRAINELVFAMLFVVAVGLGPFAGVMAIFVHTTGIIAKLFSEAVEAIDPRPVEGIRATGAGRIQEVVFGVIPQVIPLWISYSLYRFESNVRSATVLGIVGAGGIGQLLWEYVRGFYYSETAAVMIIIVISVTVIDVISQRLRKLAI